MKHFKISLIFLFCLVFSAYSQSNPDLAQAKIDYKNKEYAKALPVFEQEYYAKPTDPSVNLWYGVCLVETNSNLPKAEECLVIASKKNLPESFLYLGDIYSKEYKAEDARLQYERYAKLRPKEKTTTLKDRYEYLDRLQRLISRTEDVQIIDSIVVDKSKFLSAYKLSPEAGSLTNYNDFFDTRKAVESVVYMNGTGSKIYFGQPIEQRYFLSSMDKLLSGFGNENVMSDDNFGLSGSTNYPFVMMDGVTLYFSGIDDNGMGGYDIYVTRYNLNSDSYLTPELLNMPFNSTANDYMMVVDEIKGVGWFASDRYQPEDKVCIYTFIPNEEVVLIDSDDERYREKRARLSSIKDTWKAGSNYAELIRMARKNIERVVEKTPDFVFVINDDHTYYTLADFKSRSARSLFEELNTNKAKLSALEKDLDQKRTDYSKASSVNKNALAEQILQLENKERILNREISELQILVRNEEIKALK